MIDDGRLVRADLESITAVGRLKVVRVESILAANLEHTLHRRGDILVQAIRELDHDHGPLSRRTKKASDDSSTRCAAYLAKDYFHAPKLAQLIVRAKRTRKNPAILCLQTATPVVLVVRTDRGESVAARGKTPQAIRRREGNHRNFRHRASGTERASP